MEWNKLNKLMIGSVFCIFDQSRTGKRWYQRSRVSKTDCHLRLFALWLVEKVWKRNRKISRRRHSQSVTTVTFCCPNPFWFPSSNYKLSILSAIYFSRSYYGEFSGPSMQYLPWIGPFSTTTKSYESYDVLFVHFRVGRRAVNEGCRKWT